MHKQIYMCLKKGIDLAAESLKLLWQKPVLLSYYTLFILAHSALFIIAYNFLGHFELPTLELTHEFHIPQQNLLAELLPETGGLVYIAFLLSVFSNILLRSFLGVALIIHTYGLLTHGPSGISYALKQALSRRSIIVQWSSLITALTFFALLWNQLPLPQWTSGPLLSIISVAWSALTFFVLPIIALKRQSINASIQLSSGYLIPTINEIAGGLLWGLILILLLYCSILLVSMLAPMLMHPLAMQIILLTLSTLAISAYLIFKTKLYLLMQTRKKVETDEEPTPDFSQF